MFLRRRFIAMESVFIKPQMSMVISFHSFVLTSFHRPQLYVSSGKALVDGLIEGEIGLFIYKGQLL